MQHFGLQNGLLDSEMAKIFRCAGQQGEPFFIAKGGARRKKGEFLTDNLRVRQNSAQHFVLHNSFLDSERVRPVQSVARTRVCDG